MHNSISTYMSTLSCALCRVVAAGGLPSDDHHRHAGGLCAARLCLCEPDLGRRPRLAAVSCLCPLCTPPHFAAVTATALMAWRPESLLHLPATCVNVNMYVMQAGHCSHLVLLAAADLPERLGRQQVPQVRAGHRFPCPRPLQSLRGKETGHGMAWHGMVIRERDR